VIYHLSVAVVARFALEFGRRNFRGCTCSTVAGRFRRHEQEPPSRLASMMPRLPPGGVGTEPVTGALRLTFGSTAC